MDLEIDESNLTGETNPRRKHCEPITANSFAELALSERDNIGFMGTLVRNGEYCNWFWQYGVKWLDINSWSSSIRSWIWYCGWHRQRHRIWQGFRDDARGW